MNEPKKEAERIFNEHYVSILEDGEELSEEIIISVLAQKAALITVGRIIKDNKNNHQWGDNVKLEERFRHGLSRNVYYWKAVKEELEKK